MAPAASRRALILGAVVLALTGLGAVVVAARREPEPRTYVVVLRDDADAPVVAREAAARFGVSVTHIYEHALRGYAARISADRVADVRADPRVVSVDEDRTVRSSSEP